jgi:GDP-4-dehydro-6-deoxy-D-mannose reductase
MRVLITGMSGFAGSHLTDLLLRQTHWMLIGVSKSASGDRISPRINWWQLDLTDPDAVRRLIKYERPDIIFHLAAQSHVPTAWKEPWSTFEANVRSEVNLFQALIAVQAFPRVLIVSSNEVYGPPVLNEQNQPADLPFRENRPARPGNPYGVSKAAQELVGMQYRASHGFDVVVARPFNHIGPGQRPDFAISDLAHQVAEIEAELREPVMRLGNLSAQRDFTDVRDTVRAYYELVRKADSGSVTNVCSGTPRSIQSALDILLGLSTHRISVETDPSKFRVADTPISYGDNTLLTQTTGWLPQIPFEQSVTDILNDWRQKVRVQRQHA